MSEISRRRLKAAAVAFSVLTAFTQPTGAETRTLRRAVYDYAVTSYCGLLSPEVEQGFQRELAELTAGSGLGEEEAKAQRIAGWVDADREWSNRGLGGFRAWCGSDGAAAAQHFLAIQRGAVNSQKP